MEDDIINISDTIEVHPARLGYAVVRNGSVYGTYIDRDTAIKLARELAEEEAEK